MTTAKAYVKAILLLLHTLFSYLTFVPSFLLKLVGKSNLLWRNWSLTLWGKGCARIIGMDIHVKGEPPKAPFFLVSNHLSYVDIFVYSAVSDVIFVAKSEVKSWPVIGFMMSTMGIIFVDRSSRKDVMRVNKLISDNINPEQGILLFPEGTTSNGESVLPFKASLLAFPAEKEIPVNYASLSYYSESGKVDISNDVCWWGDMEFFTHLLQLLRVQKFSVSVNFGSQRISDGDRKVLTSKLYNKISDQYTPIPQQKHIGEREVANNV